MFCRLAFMASCMAERSLFRSLILLLERTVVTPTSADAAKTTTHRMAIIFFIRFPPLLCKNGLIYYSTFSVKWKGFSSTLNNLQYILTKRTIFAYNMENMEE